MEVPKEFEGAFRQLLDSAPDAMVIVDGEGRIVLANYMTERLFGYTPAELAGQPVEILMPERFRAGHQQYRHGYHTDPRVRSMGEGLRLRAKRKDGSEFPVEISLSPMQTSEGVLITSAIRDVTERLKIQEALEQHAQELARSNSDLEQFAYVASHDLQEPLRIVASFAQLLARRYESKLDAEADEFIGYIVDGARRMQDLINDLLAYSRVSSRGAEFAPTDFNEVVGQALRNLQIAIEETDARVETGSLPTISADEAQMAQLFQNLIGNAIKFRRTGVSPQVHVSAVREDGHYLFSVKDNGIGLDTQYAERVFALFQRLHGKSDYPGTGIGLAICKKIVERHGGRIWLESEPGQGTSFFFTIPDRQGRGDGQQSD